MVEPFASAQRAGRDGSGPEAAGVRVAPGLAVEGDSGGCPGPGWVAGGGAADGAGGAGVVAVGGRLGDWGGSGLVVGGGAAGGAGGGDSAPPDVPASGSHGGAWGAGLKGDGSYSVGAWRSVDVANTGFTGRQSGAGPAAGWTEVVESSGSALILAFLWCPAIHEVREG